MTLLWLAAVVLPSAWVLEAAVSPALMRQGVVWAGRAQTRHTMCSVMLNVHSAESRAKISAANKGKTPWNAGKEHSEETRQKIAEGSRRAALAREQKRDAERRAAIEAARESDPALYAQLLHEEEQVQKRRARRIARAEAKALGLPTPAEERRRKREEAKKSREAKAALAAKAKAERAERTGSKFSPEARARISESLKQRWRDPEYRSARNYTTSAETRAKLSEAMKARWRNGTYRATVLTNTSHSEERKRKISEAIRKKWADPEYRNRTVEAIQAVHQNATRRKYKRTPQEERLWRQRISQSMRRRWQEPNFHAQAKGRMKGSRQRGQVVWERVETGGSVRSVRSAGSGGSSLGTGASGQLGGSVGQGRAGRGADIGVGPGPAGEAALDAATRDAAARAAAPPRAQPKEAWELWEGQEEVAEVEEVEEVEVEVEAERTKEVVRWGNEVIDFSFGDDDDDDDDDESMGSLLTSGAIPKFARAPAHVTTPVRRAGRPVKTGSGKDLIDRLLDGEDDDDDDDDDDDNDDDDPTDRVELFR